MNTEVLHRVNRVKGQFEAVIHMLEEDVSYEKVMPLLGAVISALEGVRMELVKAKVKTSIESELEKAMKSLK